MECMSEAIFDESMMWKLLEKEGLADLSQFHRPRFFDEVPLYSRESDIAFLMGDSRAAAGDILLRFSLKFLSSIISYEEHRTPYFAAITIRNPSGDDPFVPNIFIWSGPTRQLGNKLILDMPTTSFGKKIEASGSSRLHPLKRFDVLEDTSLAPDPSRAFIGLSQPPYRSYVPLDRFLKKTVSPAN